MKNRWASRRDFVLLLLPYDIRVHSSVVRAADRRSAGPWLKSGCALGHFDPWAERSFSPRFSCPEIKIILASPQKYIPMPHGPRHVRFTPLLMPLTQKHFGEPRKIHPDSAGPDQDTRTVARGTSAGKEQFPLQTQTKKRPAPRSPFPLPSSFFLFFCF